MRFNAVIFDMDGLIIDTETPVQACCQRAASDMGFDLDDDFYVSSLVGRGWEDCRHALDARFGPAFDYSDFRTRFQGRWGHHIDSVGIAVKPGFRELFSLIREHGLLTAVATSTHADDARESLRAAGVNETFDAFITGDQVALGKPDPEIYLRAAEALRVVPQQCVALEDSSPGALAAARAGMTTLIIPDGGRMPSDEATRAAFRVLPSLHHAREWLAAVNFESSR
jgi:HAD superfamily hydrolase (TIGR01509 family)